MFLLEVCEIKSAWKHSNSGVREIFKISHSQGTRKFVCAKIYMNKVCLFLSSELKYAVAQQSTKPSEQRKYDEDFKAFLVVVQSGVDVLDECFRECLILAVEHNQHVKG